MDYSLFILGGKGVEKILIMTNCQKSLTKASKLLTKKGK
jgi:hypothetical protein